MIKCRTCKKQTNCVIAFCDNCEEYEEAKPHLYALRKWKVTEVIVTIVEFPETWNEEQVEEAYLNSPGQCGEAWVDNRQIEQLPKEQS